LGETIDEELELAHVPLPTALEAALDATPEARAALVFTPSYYGTSADVKALADACHARDLPLVTDDAWGLDYSFGHPALPPSALESGSDLAIGSVHKTLSALTQTSVLSVGSGRIDTERLQLLRDRGVGERVVAAAVEHRRRPAPVRARRP
jgi:arginine decarboxylase